MADTFSSDDLRLVRAIGASGTLTGAARGLKVDHSTAFRRLCAIEVRLGAKLFERARDGYTPTSAGEMVIAAGERILAELVDLERRLAGEDLRPSGIVRLTTTDTLVDVIAPALAALKTEHPGITVELIVANTFFTLTRREADIALRPAAAAPEGLAGRRLATVATAPTPRRLTSTDAEGNPYANMTGSASRTASAICARRVGCRQTCLKNGSSFGRTRCWRFGRRRWAASAWRPCLAISPTPQPSFAASRRHCPTWRDRCGCSPTRISARSRAFVPCSISWLTRFPGSAA
jgi:DNA-binding transcriptional LysR family regulator